MSDWIDAAADLVGMNPWTVQAFLVILGALLLDLFARRFFNHLAGLAGRSENLWDDAVVYAGKRPVSVLIYGQGILLAARIIHPHTSAALFDQSLLELAQQLLLVFAGTWFAFRLATGFERAYVHQRQHRDEQVDVTTVQVLGRIVRIAIVLTGTLTILAILDIPISGFLAAGGVGGIAAGLAARDLLANFFGGFMVFLDRPFSVGDWIRSPDRDIEGVVTEIGWRVTTIMKFDKRPIYVPNATFTSIAVENPSRMTHRRIHEHIGVRYDDFSQLRSIVEACREMLQSHPEIATDQTLIVNFNRYGESSLDIMIYAFTKTTVWTEYHRVREDVLLRIGEIIEAHGAEIAFPTRTLKVDALPELRMHESGEGA
ncbi:MAG: mechanosensitive ion channel family protein [Wenzhouxiangellaceae bacterium]